MQQSTHAAPATYLAVLPQLWQRRVTCDEGGGGKSPGSRSIAPAQDGQLKGAPVLSLETKERTCAGLYVFGRGFRIDPPEYGGDPPILRTVKTVVGFKAMWRNILGRLSVVGFALCVASLPGCGPRANIPPIPVSLERALAPLDSVAVLARQLAPVLYVTPAEKFPLVRVVAVVHPSLRLIAYNLLWADDIHGSWIPFTVPTDQEVVWVGYDETKAPTDVWTYWHGFFLHTRWPKKQVAINVQWGKHGSMPRGMNINDLPPSHSLKLFYGATMVLLPDIWLGDLTRRGPLCFCHTYGSYLDYSIPILLNDRIDFVVRQANPDAELRAVFGHYSRKPFWPLGF